MKNYKQQGLSLIELMIAVTISMILSIAAVYLYTGQMKTFTQTARKEATELEARAVIQRLENLIRQAVICTHTGCESIQPINITYAGATTALSKTTLMSAGKSVSISLNLPSGYAIWPNETAPYTSNAVAINWSNATTSANKDQILVNGAVMSGNSNTKIINLDLWPLNANGTEATVSSASPLGGYRLSITARIGTKDSSYINSLDSADALGLKNYRTITFESVILPRN